MCPSLADTRSMMCEWLPAESCDGQLTDWVIACFHAGGRSAGLFGVPRRGGAGGPRGWGTESLVTLRWEACPPFSSALGCLERRPICSLWASGQVVSYSALCCLE